MLPLLAALAPQIMAGLAGGGGAAMGAAAPLSMGAASSGAPAAAGILPAGGGGGDIMAKLQGLFSSGTRQGADLTPEQFSNLGADQQKNAYQTALQQAKLDEARGYAMGQSGTGAGKGATDMGSLFSQAAGPVAPPQMQQAPPGPRGFDPQMNSYIQSLLGG